MRTRAKAILDTPTHESHQLHILNLIYNYPNIFDYYQYSEQK
jgi:hypothetical protein